MLGKTFFEMFSKFSTFAFFVLPATCVICSKLFAKSFYGKDMIQIVKMPMSNLSQSFTNLITILVVAYSLGGDLIDVKCYKEF